MKQLVLILLLMVVTSASYSQNLYDIDNITLIEIEFSESDWDNVLDQYYANDIDERLATSTFKINGVSYDSVGVKFKGNSTYNTSNLKNPLNIKLDYVLNQTYQNYTTFKLSNGFRDPTFIKEVMAYEIGRQYMDMPLSNFAKVYINGSYYGLFTSNESINNEYIERRFYANKNNTIFKGNATELSTYGVSPSLEYLGTDSSSYLHGYELKTDFGWNQMVILCQQLSTLTSIESILDVDRALWMLAFNNVVVNLDSYSGAPRQNYYLIQDDNGRFLPIIWDLNGCFAGFTKLTNGGGGPPSPPQLSDYTDMDLFIHIGDATFPLISKLLSINRYKKMYVAHCRTILEENLSINYYNTRGTELQSIIAAEIQNEPNGFYTYTEFSNALNTSTGTGPNSIYGINQVLDARTTYLEARAEILAVQPIVSNIIISSYQPNSTTTITASITNTNYAYLGYREYKGDVFIKMEMFDDGVHNDGAANDGVYGVDVFLNSKDIQYYLYAENANSGVFSPVRAEHEFYDLILDNEVVINEIMTKNNATVSDQDGDYNDWVEFYNTTSSSIDLSGYYLSNDPNNLNKWIFPTATIQANDYLVVWLDKDTLQSGFHANFKMSSNGDVLYFSNAVGELISSVQIPALESSTTYGRFPNGTGNFMRMLPTFSAQNSFTSLSIDENEITLENESKVTIYPNPVSNNVNISLVNNQENEFIIFNCQGKIIKEGIFFNTVKIDMTDLESGIYFVKIEGQNEVGKIIKL